MGASSVDLNRPWMVAAWPGMGGVAIGACYYLMAKLKMTQIAEFPSRELFDIDHIDVEGGLIQPVRLPRNRFFSWADPNGAHDLVVFLGEAQPPAGKRPFCQKVIDHAVSLGVEKVFTFAAMATEMHPGHEARVFGAAIDRETLLDLERLEVHVLTEGRISGLNGVLLGVAGDEGLPGGCLLGEMPHLFSRIPFPKASLAVLDAFAAMARIDLDLSELAAQARRTERELGQLLARIEEAITDRQGRASPPEDEEAWKSEAGEKPEPRREAGLSDEDHHRIESLFKRAANDRSKAYELKAELDRLDVFHRYEDRFLELFR